MSLDYISHGTPSSNLVPGGGTVAFCLDVINAKLYFRDDNASDLNVGWNLIAGGTGARTVNIQTSTYSFVNSDNNNANFFNSASAIAATLPQAGSAGNFASGWTTYVENIGTGILTITPTTSTINGMASLVLAQYQSVTIFSDGTNYEAFFTKIASTDSASALSAYVVNDAGTGAAQNQIVMRNMNTGVNSKRKALNIYLEHDGAQSNANYDALQVNVGFTVDANTAASQGQTDAIEAYASASGAGVGAGQITSLKARLSALNGVTVTNANGFLLYLPQVDATSTVTNFFGFIIDAPSGGGTVTNWCAAIGLDPGIGVVNAHGYGGAFGGKSGAILADTNSLGTWGTDSFIGHATLLGGNMPFTLYDGWYSGNGTPEGSATAVVGSIASRRDGGAGTSFYVKESGSGNTGWKAVLTATSVISWSSLGNATANLVLSNGAFTTEFDQTSNVAWLWKNTTVATASTTNASPLLEVAANYWTGSASAVDTWTIGSTLAAGTNGISTLKILRTGSTGASQIQLDSTGVSLTNPTVIGPAGPNTGLVIGNAVSVPFIVCDSAGTSDLFRGALQGAYMGTITANVNDTNWDFLASGASGRTDVGLSASPAANNTFPLVSLGYIGTTWTTTGAGPYIGVNIGSRITGISSSTASLFWTPNAGAGNFYALQIAPTINQTGTASGSYKALRIAVTETALLGTANKLIDCFAGVSGTTSVFALDNSGKVTQYAGVATVSQGMPAEYAVVDLTAQSAAIAATTLYTVPAGGGGMYRVSWSATITTAGTTSVLGGSNGFQTVYTSPTDSVVKTTVPGNSVTSSANTTGTAIGGTEVVYAAASTNIQYKFDYTSTGTAMVYELHVKLERM